MLDRPKLSPAAQTFPEASTGLPLSGFRIVELTTAWAGPMAGRILACLGAEVVHIEPANNLDSWRSYTALPLLQRYPKQEIGERRYNRASLFNSQNTDKLSLSLDLKAPGGKDTFRDLIAKADGLITNFTPGMLQRLGFGNEALVVDQPGPVRRRDAGLRQFRRDEELDRARPDHGAGRWHVRDGGIWRRPSGLDRPGLSRSDRRVSRLGRDADRAVASAAYGRSSARRGSASRGRDAIDRRNPASRRRDRQEPACQRQQAAGCGAARRVSGDRP